MENNSYTLMKFKLFLPFYNTLPYTCTKGEEQGIKQHFFNPVYSQIRIGFQYTMKQQVIDDVKKDSKPEVKMPPSLKMQFLRFLMGK